MTAAMANREEHTMRQGLAVAVAAAALTLAGPAPAPAAAGSTYEPAGTRCVTVRHDPGVPGYTRWAAPGLVCGSTSPATSSGQFSARGAVAVAGYDRYGRRALPLAAAVALADRSWPTRGVPRLTKRLVVRNERWRVILDGDVRATAVVTGRWPDGRAFAFRLWSAPGVGIG
jgi:hypothetical protein